MLVVGFGSYFYVNQPLPNGQKGPEADALARKMMASIDHDSWLETGALAWGYENRDYIWDKQNHLVQVRFDGHNILVDINERRGMILDQPNENSSKDAQKLCLLAWQHWVNDSFWLNPISKVFDDGTERRLVVMEDASEALLVTYTSGGATPGDSYLWTMNDDGLPTSWSFWVSIIPIGGLPFTWESWVKLSTGVMISTHHYNPIKTVDIFAPKAARELSELADDDLFDGLENDAERVISF